MTSKNKFGFGPLDTTEPVSRRSRSVGPMGAAVREAADSLQETTEAKVEQRRLNARDAKEFREASEQGRVLQALPLSEISTDELPRDRLELEAVAVSAEMDELKASIRERGQKEPIEVFLGADGGYQLKKGWRRFTALSQLLEETGDAQFSTILARVDRAEDDRITRYIDMVEENVVREDLTFAEMAQVVIAAAQDDQVEGSDPDALVGRLYASLHKMKRSYIRSFVYLLTTLGETLQWPKDVSRNLGADVARAIKSGQGDVEALRQSLAACSDRDAQAVVLAGFVSVSKSGTGTKTIKSEPKEKFEFHVGELKVTARNGECRIVGRVDFAGVPKDQLERAIRAFNAALDE